MPAVLGLAYGAYQGISKGIKAHNAEKDLENYSNSFQPNAGIVDLYSKALSKYSANPYTSQSYQQSTNQNQRNLSTGLNAAINKRQGLGAIAGLTQQADDNNAKAVINSENLENQNFGRLQQATQLKAGEEQKKFDRTYNLKALKAGQAAAGENMGISNVYNGIGALNSLYGAATDGGGLGTLYGNYRTNRKLDRTIGMGNQFYSPQNNFTGNF